MYEENLIGASCELLHPYLGYTRGEIIEVYGNQLLVRLTSGKEITLYRSDIKLL